MLATAVLRSARTRLPNNRRAFSILGGMSDDLLISMNMGHSIGGTSQASLVDSLINAGVLVTPRVQNAFRSLDRGQFVFPGYSPSDIYANRPLKIGTIATISTPQQHAQVMELLAPHLQPGNQAIDVGCGSGYLAAAMAHLVGPSGHVVGVDIVPSLVDFSTMNVAKAKVPCNFSWIASNGKDILPPNAYFDCIHVGVAVETMDEIDALAASLHPGGALVVPLGYASSEQLLLKVIKQEDGTLAKERVMSVLCQPLLSEAPAPLPVPETRAEKLARLQAALEIWKVSFIEENGRTPTRDDIQQDPTASKLFAEFAATRK
ncbi:protein-L-isoaspartate O-methyltransferase [Aphanomyces invadans]|uniref:protein-L-isoaspartate(D-aspartate) O-methyltransferase n=1 Tax=Aphanomyces invadans TaxID=157072 RepID=A0A024UA37_9STRA|nr:protein-L-isoaspartate O-methyltransferase [Aphanomyces invadans]ETW03080.1 protein-L-isoaspartate O-methyltransferase [Aphanomyces invadans]|eukprot:XP_008868464.1 protein-L-isoaspartate O-methyltransferase [Aphanomyces invadans]